MVYKIISQKDKKIPSIALKTRDCPLNICGEKYTINKIYIKNQQMNVILYLYSLCRKLNVFWVLTIMIMIIVIMN